MTLEMKYFVLKPKGNDLYALASRAAMLEYAGIIKMHNPDLAHELRMWVHKEVEAANKLGD